MIIPARYELSKTIAGLLQDIERLKTSFELIPQPKSIEKFARQKSILKSAVYSARIEGNPKTIREVTLRNIQNSRKGHKRELFNIYRAMEYCLTRSWKKDLTLSDIKKLHERTLQHLSSESGRLRQQPSAIFNQAGVAVYLSPPPQDIVKLLANWLHYVNAPSEPLIPVKAAVSHFSFEKIHPFSDGNGRVGRLLIHTVLKKWGYDLKGLISFEEYLDLNRQTYYDLLGLTDSNITGFIEFFLEGLTVALEKAFREKRSSIPPTKETFLPLRRHELLQIIRDHRQVTFDFIHRRFFTVSGRLLRYDLKKLQDGSFIRKRGVTKGVVYEPVEVEEKDRE